MDLIPPQSAASSYRRRTFGSGSYSKKFGSVKRDSRGEWIENEMLLDDFFLNKRRRRYKFFFNSIVFIVIYSCHERQKWPLGFTLQRQNDR